MGLGVQDIQESMVMGVNPADSKQEVVPWDRAVLGGLAPRQFMALAGETNMPVALIPG